MKTKEWLVSLYFADDYQEGEQPVTKEQVIKAFNQCKKLTVSLPSDVGGELRMVDYNDVEEYQQ